MRVRIAMALACRMVPALMATPAARADGSSILTLGLGGGVGVRQAGGTGVPTESAFINQANVRLKFLEIFGLDYAVDLTRDPTLVTASDDALQYKAKMRMTALIYPYNGEDVAFYIGAGVGGAKLSELKRLDAPTNSYTAGLGFEFHIASHLSIDASFMLVVPGARSIKNVAVARVKAALESGDPVEMTRLTASGLGDFVSLDNHEIKIRLLLFL